MAADLLIVVPARGGSRRLPGKNLRPLGGRPMLAHTAAAIAEAGLDAPCLLTTDDDAIADCGRGLGWLVPFVRPAHLATDQASTADTVRHALDWFAADRGGEPRLLMVLQPTSPLRGGACLRAGLDMLAADTALDAVVAVTAVHLPPARLFLADEAGRATALSGDAHRPVYAPNGALYLVRAAAFRRTGSLYAGTLGLLALDPLRAIDIDTAADAALAEALLAAGMPTAVPAPAAPSLPGAVA